MEKNEITILNLIVKNVKGEKDNKKYDFLSYELVLENGQKVNFVPYEKDKKLLEYMLRTKYIKGE